MKIFGVRNDEVRKKVEEHDVLPPFVIVELYDDYSSQFSAALRK